MALMIVGTLFMFIQSNQNVVAENKNVVPAPFTEIRGNFYGLNYRYTIYESLQKELTFEGQFNELFLEAFNQSAGLNFPTIYESFNISNPLTTKITFKKDYLGNKIKMPRSVQSFLYKNMDTIQIEGLNNLDISDTEDFSFMFSDSPVRHIDISEWDTSNKNMMNFLSNTDLTSIKLGLKTLLLNQDKLNYSATGTWVNQETGKTYDNEEFPAAYDGSEPGTYVFNNL